MGNEFMKNFLGDQPETSDAIEVSGEDIARFCLRISGVKQDGMTPKCVGICNSYEFENENEDEIMEINDNPKYELVYDKITGFYTLDIVFNSEEDSGLKLLWAKLQRFRLMQLYDAEKLFVFVLQITEMISDDEIETTKNIMTATIINPLLYYLVRKVPNERIREYEVEKGILVGGNTIRMLLHPDLVSFSSVDIDESDLEEESES